ncbi:hypothetical protein AB4Z22_20520, partial [Paenibacillus sp. TAF58]
SIPAARLAFHTFHIEMNAIGVRVFERPFPVMILLYYRREEKLNRKSRAAMRHRLSKKDINTGLFACFSYF